MIKNREAGMRDKTVQIERQNLQKRKQYITKKVNLVVKKCHQQTINGHDNT